MSDQNFSRLWTPGKIVPAQAAGELPVWQLEALSGPVPGDTLLRPQTLEDQRLLEANRQAIAAAAERLAAQEAAQRAAAAQAAAAAIEAAQQAAADVVPDAAPPGAAVPPPAPAVDPAEIERIKTAAFDEGYAAGYDHGAVAARTETDRLRALAASAASVFEHFESDLAPHLIDLAMGVARQVVMRELRTDRHLILDVVRSAFQQMTGGETGKHLLLHPADAALVRAHLGDELAIGHWKIIEDDGIAQGGCRIATQQSEIDATIETRWKRTVAALGRDDALADAEDAKTDD